MSIGHMYINNMYSNTFIPSIEKECKINATAAERELVFKLWPENFLGLYDMGFRAFERLFSYRPQLMTAMNLPPNGEEWKKNEKMKKIVLALEQTLTKAMATYADPVKDEESTPENFAEHMQEIGGLHRVIVPALAPENFELMFKLLPEIIADVTASRREEGPLTTEMRASYVGVWNSISVVMCKHFILGWERRILPKDGKLKTVLNRHKGTESSDDDHDIPVRGRAATDCLPGPSRRRAQSRNQPHRSSTQVDMSPTSSSAYLERGNSAPIALHDLSLEFHDHCDLSP